jgi:hypothetical protein
MIIVSIAIAIMITAGYIKENWNRLLHKLDGNQAGALIQTKNL